MIQKLNFAPEVFVTSRQMDFFSESELVTQTGHCIDEWPLVFVKELVDNAVDAIEETDASPVIEVVVNESGITVTDNGPGITDEVINGVLDFSVRASSREAYVTPSRGRQGNALMTLVAMPYVLCGDGGALIVDSCGKRREIRVKADPLLQKPQIRKSAQTSLRDDAEKAKMSESGTLVSFVWDEWPFDFDHDDTGDEFGRSVPEHLFELLQGYCLFNPHLEMRFDWFGDVHHFEPTNKDFKKWRTGSPSSPHWYTPDRLARLIGACIAKDTTTGNDRTIRDFVAQFDGLKRDSQRKLIVEKAGLQGEKLSTLASDSGLDSEAISKLLSAMQEVSKPVVPKRLGVIGKKHFSNCLESWGCDSESIKYQKFIGYDDDGLPVVLELAFGVQSGYFSDLQFGERRKIIAGANFATAIKNPFRDFGGHAGLETLLSDRLVRYDSPVIVAVHLACPLVRYTDRGKSAIACDSSVNDYLLSMVESATKTYTRQQRAEIRSTRAALNRRKTKVVVKKDVVWGVLDAAWEKASGGNKLPASQRQLYYAARALWKQKHPGLEIPFNTFISDAYLQEFIDFHDRDWNLTKDSRGKLVEPHTGRSVPLGTLDVNEYLRNCKHSPVVATSLDIDTDYPTCGFRNRFSGIVFIEKEGFHVLLERSGLLRKYDLAIASTKGHSCVAIRHIVDEFCGGHGLPLITVSDFDPYGFLIAEKVVSDLPKYRFRHRNSKDEPAAADRVINFGLRLEDVEELALEPESFAYKSVSVPTATDAEMEYFKSGQRVELNAMTSPQFVDWFDSKCKQHGIKKVVPDGKVLDQAYRRAYAQTRLQELIDSNAKKFADEARKLDIDTDGISRLVAKQLEGDGDLSWDRALVNIVGGDE